ncbi:MAG: putative toxin-antitoxin system toxin component, PIN family [Candidatus Aenigmarchaeota archaeon]|nr:putative toxin-antitoxin system toxin component, PIN family [Candidatus Aenigmarchaeota archaeon]MDI6722140.1 putative toxin-antitoxin system toxin component, PIN family [Candidatus Aenigmarchaeota archaeon]
MIKAVLDTNIFVSSIFWEKGNPHRIVELALDKKIEVFTSVEILQELEKVLKRDFDEPDELIQRQIGLIFEYSSVIVSGKKVNVIKADPDDNKILECALVSGADYIVSGDKHLLNIKEYEGTKIIKAREFVEIIENISK